MIIKQNLIKDVHLNYVDFIQDVVNEFNLDIELVEKGKMLKDLGIDSLFLINLLTYLEDKYKVKIDIEKIVLNSNMLDIYNVIVDIINLKTKYNFLYGSLKLDTINELICTCDYLYGNKIAFEYKENNVLKNVTYSELKDDVELGAFYIKSLGFKGRNIALYGKNSYKWIVGFFSIICSGNVAVLISDFIKKDELFNLLKDSDSEFLLFDSESSVVSNQINKIKNKLSIKFMDMKEIANIKNNADDLKFSINTNINKYLPAIIMFTSGTSGRRKGVILNHYNIMSNAESICEINKLKGNTILTLPLTHSFGLTSGLILCMMFGMRIYISDGVQFLHKEIKKVKPYSMSAVPFVLDSLYNKIRKEYMDNSRIFNRIFLVKYLKKYFDSLTLVYCGGATVNVKMCKKYYKFGVNILQGYGITECSPGVTGERLKSNKFNCAGHILSCCKVKIVNKDKKGIGEVYIKGSNVTKGYYKREDLYNNSFEDGWFKTGDLGELIGNKLYIRGRKTNMILLDNGENVYPEDLEKRIFNFGYVKEVIVYEQNKQIKAKVFVDEVYSRRLKKDIINLNSKLPNFMQIRSYTIKKEEFTKNSSNKIIRNIVESQ